MIYSREDTNFIIILHVVFFIIEKYYNIINKEPIFFDKNTRPIVDGGLIFFLKK